MPQSRARNGDRDFDGNSVALTIAAHHGFEDNFLKFFEEVRNDSTVCAEAMRSAQA
jgi:hypothetical protein